MKNLQTIDFKIADRIAIITLNRPDAANGVNLQLAEELDYCAKQCAGDSAVKAVILTANGRFFSAGGDVKEMASYGDKVGPKIKQLADSLHCAISTFARMDAPVITAVNGMAAGAGFSLAITADYVIASDTSSFMMAYTKAGLSPDGSSSYYLPRLIGLRRTQELMLTNRNLKADEALDWGLVSETVPSEALMDRAMELAKGFAQGPLESNAAVKKLLLTSFTHDLETQMDIESEHISRCAMSADGREGVAAFMAKRSPVFK